jgi:site-specific recombinase XerD
MKNTYIKKKSVKKYDVVCVGFDGVGEKLLNDLKKRKYSAKSIGAYYTQMKHFFLFLAELNITELQNVTTETLEKYQKSFFENSFSPWSVRAYLRTLRILFKYLEDEGLVFDNPVHRLVTPKLDKPLPEAATEEDMRKLISAVRAETPEGVRTRAMIETAYSCALRVEELTGMDMSSVDFRQNIIRVTGKGRKERALPAGRQSIFWIKQYLLSPREILLNGNIDERALWISRIGQRMSIQAFQKIMQYLSEKSGLEKRVTPHGIRRACATHMLNNGAHPVAIQHLLGHSTLAALSHYLRMTINDLMKTHGKSKLGR